MSNFPQCPLCNKDTEPWSTGLRSIYNKHNLGVICDECGKIADSFLNYWGEKKLKDRVMLFSFIDQGRLPMKKYNAMMNGGYY